MSALVDIVDTTTRDGNQSLWSATGLTTQDITAIAPTIVFRTVSGETGSAGGSALRCSSVFPANCFPSASV